MQTQENTVQKQEPIRVYRPYSVVMGNKTPSINEVNKKYSLFHGKKVDYRIWKKYYLQDYKVDVTRKIVTEVMNGEYLDISLGDILRVGEDYTYLGENIKATIMRACYTGQDYKNDLRKLILYNLQHGTGRLYRDLVHG